MSGQHDTHKHQIAVKFHHRDWRKIEKKAEAGGQTPGEYIRDTVREAVKDIPLTPEDAQLIADRMKAAKEKGKMV